MNQTNKLCCEWRKLIWDCLANPDHPEWFKVTEGWFRCGQLNIKTSSIEFPNCQECQDFYTKYFPHGPNMEQKLAELKKMGCCQVLPAIYDLDDNVTPERVDFFNTLFEEKMCQTCQAIIDLAQKKQIYQNKNEPE